MEMKDKVKELIELGYDKDIIAISLGISNQALDRYERQIEFDKSRKQTISPKRKTKLQLLRERYYEIYYADHRPQKIKPLFLPEEETKILIEKLDSAKTTINELPKMSSTRQAITINTLMKELPNLDDRRLPLEVVVRLYDLFPGQNILKIKEERYRQKIDKKRSTYRNKSFETIQYLIDEEENIENLEKLLERLKTALPESSRNDRT